MLKQGPGLTGSLREGLSRTGFPGYASSTSTATIIEIEAIPVLVVVPTI